MGGVHPLQLLLLGLLATVAAVAGLARRLSISYPIVLVITGLLCSLLPHVPKIPLPPDVVFLVFLPPLLYAAAWQTSWREFRFNLVSISMLAVGLVFFTAFGVALTAHFFMPGFDWKLGFLLGAVVSPTDAVAATSIARRVGMPQRIVDILEGESLVNDATGLLAMEFGLQMIVSGRTPTIGHGVVQFLWLVAGGTAIGLLVGLAVWWFENWVDDGPVEIAVSIIVPYAGYLAGDEVHASGVIAVVVCGLFLSGKSSTFFSPRVRLQTLAVWDALEFLLNGLVFILIGLQLPYVLAGLEGVSRWHLAAYGLVFSAVLIALRIVWMYPGARIAWVIRTKLLHQSYEMPGARGVFVLGWTGMRGVVALAAAISLPYTVNGGGAFPQRSLIVFLTFSVILVTLVLQGLSLPALIRRLRLDGADGPQCEEGEARRILLRTAIDFLKEGREQHSDGERHAYDDLLHEYEHKLEEVEECGPEATAGDPQAVTMRGLLLKTVRRERQELISLQRSGRVSDSVLRTLERELDLSESRLLS